MKQKIGNFKHYSIHSNIVDNHKSTNPLRAKKYAKIWSPKISSLPIPVHYHVGNYRLFIDSSDNTFQK